MTRPNQLETGDYWQEKAQAAVTLGKLVTLGSNPLPAPSPSAQCKNCKGVGWLGDRTIWIQCQECNADGRIPKPVKEEDVSVKIEEAIKPHFDRMIDKLDTFNQTISKFAVPTQAPPIPEANEPKPATGSTQAPVKEPPKSIKEEPPAVTKKAFPFIDDKPGHWSFPGSSIHDHLLYDVIINGTLHRGHAQDPALLAGKTEEELKALHDALHEGKTQGFPSTSNPIINSGATQMYTPMIQGSSPCPPGQVCPNNRTQTRWGWK